MGKEENSSASAKPLDQRTENFRKILKELGTPEKYTPAPSSKAEDTPQKSKPPEYSDPKPQNDSKTNSATEKATTNNGPSSQNSGLEAPPKADELGTKELFNESLSAVQEFDQKKLKLIYNQIKEEKILSNQLNDKIQTNLTKIYTAEKKLTDYKARLEKELIKKNSQLVKAERLSAIVDVSSRISHDIKNPLSVIKNGVALIEKTNQNMKPAEKDNLDRIHRAITRISHQIDGVLEYVSNKPLNKVKLPIGDIIQSSIDTTVIPDDVHIHLEMEDVMLSCDPVQSESIFSNLILNSIQAMENSGNIDVKLFSKDNFGQIEITDDGPGIPPDKIDGIFEPLYTTKQTGTGLGLTSVKSIVERHGGSISIANNSGKGITCKVKLPIAC